MPGLREEGGEAMSEWRTMESAPRDGSFILLCRAGEDYEYSTHVYVGTYVLFDDDPCDCVWLADGLYHSDGCFTHWMPLPEPPK